MDARSLRRQPLPTLSRPRSSPYDSVSHTLSGLEQRADKIAGQLAERGPTIEAHLRRLPSELQHFGARKLVPSTQPPMTVPKLLPRPFTAGPDAAELAQRFQSCLCTDTSETLYSDRVQFHRTGDRVCATSRQGVVLAWLHGRGR